MMRLLRKHRQWLMIVIAILAIPFVFYFVQKPDYASMHSDEFIRLYNKSVRMVEAQRDARLHDLAVALGMDQFVEALSGGLQGMQQQPNEAYSFFTINLIILRHEAEQLGIQPTHDEIVSYIRDLRAFRGPTGFDPNKYREFTETLLPANGFTDEQVEQLARDAISLNRIKQLVTLGVSLPESESKANFEQANGKLFVHAFRIKAADFTKDIQVSDADVKTYYDSHQATLKTPEKRKIEFIALNLTDEQKKLTGKERIEALQKLADKSNEVSQALAQKRADFHEVASKMQLPVKSTGEFTADAPDPQIKGDAQVVATAFQLTPQDPTSDPVQTPDGYYIVHLAGVTPSRPLTLDEAKPQIVEALKTTRGKEAAANKGRQAVPDLRSTLKSGAPLKFALEKVNLKDDALPPFTLLEVFDPTNPDANKQRPPDFMTIKSAAAQVQPGEVSEFYPSEDGGVIVYVEKREPPDEAKYKADKATFDERFLRNKREIVFQEWLRDRQVDAGLISREQQPGVPGAAPQQRPARPPQKPS